MDKVKQYMYYGIIALISLIALIFLPMLGSVVGLGWQTPNTVVGWIVWVTIKLIVSFLNVLIFHCFLKQGLVNVKDDEHYKKAREILQRNKDKDSLPRSPKKWNAQQYGGKGVSIFIASALTTVALTQAFLTYDYVALLTYLFTIISGIIFGIISMKGAEEYYTNEFYAYALMKEKELNELAANSDNSVDINACAVDNSGCSEDACDTIESTQENVEGQGEHR